MSAYLVDRKAWSELSIFEQMGNIGSEVGRSINAKHAEDKESFEGALLRTLDLFDATVEVLVARQSVRAREVLRAKDQYLQLFFGDTADLRDAPQMENYFMQFALAARLSR